MVAVERAWTCWPIRRQGTEYKAGPTLMWMSGPTLPVDQVANTNGVVGSGLNAGASTAAKTAPGAAPSSGRHDRAPATSWHQRTAPDCMSCKLVNARPRQKESSTYRSEERRVGAEG